MKGGRVPLRAKFGGTCPFCGQPYQRGAFIAKVMDGWGHDDCRQEWRRREQVLSGDTYRSRKPSQWRRGSSPGDVRGRV